MLTVLTYLTRSDLCCDGQVRLESIGAEDIVDGNPRLILGLIWTIILRFQIEVIDIDIVSTRNRYIIAQSSCQDSISPSPGTGALVPDR